MQLHVTSASEKVGGLSPSPKGGGPIPCPSAPTPMVLPLPHSEGRSMRYSRKMDFDGGGHPAISVGSLSAAVTQRYHASADRCFNNCALGGRRQQALRQLQEITRAVPSVVSRPLTTGVFLSLSRCSFSPTMISCTSRRRRTYEFQPLGTETIGPTREVQKQNWPVRTVTCLRLIAFFVLFTRATLCIARFLPSSGVCPSIRYTPVLCLNG